MKNFFKKSIISALLAITIFYAAAPALSSVFDDGFSGFTSTAYAEDTPANTVDGEYVLHATQPCGVKNTLGCITLGIYFITQFIHLLSTYVNWAGGEIFDSAILFSITGDVFKTEMINTGWELIRDFANLFFIFIILYIAIATILQIGTYGGKDLLVKVIIAAVLINFSLLFTKIIIDSSHILAWSFYDKIDTQGGVNFPEINGAIHIVDIEKDAATKFLSGVATVGMQTPAVIVGTYEYYTSATKFYNGVKDAVTGKLGWFGEKDSKEKETNAEKIIKAQKEGKEVIEVTLSNLSLLYILSAVLNFISGFVFFAGAALFIIRVVVLWILMIFSPLGFVSSMLPKTLAAHSGKWWDQLIKQAFFAPAFLFMFVIITELINSNFLKATVVAAQDSAVKSIFPASVEDTIVVIFHFIVVIFLLIAALYVAQKMGAVGSDMAMSSGKKAGNWARNKFGDKAAMRGGMYGGRRMAGLAGEGLLRAQRNADGSQNRFGKAIGTIPLVNRGFAAASSWREKQIKGEEESRKKKFGSYSDAGLTAMKGQVFTKSAGKTIEGIEKERGVKKNREEKDKEKYYNDMVRLSGRSRADVERIIQSGARSSLDADISARDAAIKAAGDAAKATIQTNLSTKEAELMLKTIDLDNEIKTNGAGTVKAGTLVTDIATAKNELAKLKAANATIEQKNKEREGRAKSVVNYENKIK